MLTLSSLFFQMASDDEDWDTVQVDVPSHNHTYFYDKGMGTTDLGLDTDRSDESIPIIEIPESPTKPNRVPGTTYYGRDTTAEPVESDRSEDEEDIPVIEVPDSPTKPYASYNKVHIDSPPTRQDTGCEHYEYNTDSNRANSTPLYYYDEDLGFVDGYESADQNELSIRLPRQSGKENKKKDGPKKAGERAEVASRRQKFHRGFNYVRARYPSQFHQADGASKGSKAGSGGNFKLPPSLCPQTRYGKEARIVNAKDRSNKKKKWPEPPVYPPREKVKDASTMCEILKLVDKMDVGAQCVAVTTETAVQCPLAMSDASTQYPRIRKKETATQADTPEMVTEGTQNVPETRNVMVETCYRLVYSSKTFVVTDDTGCQCDLMEPDSMAISSITPSTEPSRNEMVTQCTSPMPAPPTPTVEPPTDESSYQSVVMGTDDETLEDEGRHSRLSMETAAGDIKPRIDPVTQCMPTMKIETPGGDDDTKLDLLSARSDDVAVLTIDTDRSDDVAIIQLNTPRTERHEDGGNYSSDWDSDDDSIKRLTNRTRFTDGNEDNDFPDDCDSVSVAVREDAHD